MNYTMQELENGNSYRQAEELSAKTLPAAKREASRRQEFQGTVLIISANGERVAKKVDGAWINCGE